MVTGQVVGAVRHGGLVEHVTDAPGRRAGASEPVEVAERGADARAEHRVPRRREQLPDAQLARCQPEAAHPDHRRLQQRDDDGRLDAGAGVDAPQGEAVGAQARQRPQHALGLQVLGPRGGDGARAGQRVDQPGGDVALRLLVARRDGRRLPQERAQDHPDEGEPDGERHGEPGVDEREGDEGPGRRHEQGHGRDQRLGGGPHLLGVGSRPGDQVAGREAPRDRGTGGQHVPHDALPKPAGGLRAAGSCREDRHGVARDHRDDERHADQEGVGDAGAGSDEQVDRAAQRAGEQKLDHGAGQRGHGVHRGPAATAAQHFEQKPVRRPVHLAAWRLGVRHRRFSFRGIRE